MCKCEQFNCIHHQKQFCLYRCHVQNRRQQADVILFRRISTALHWPQFNMLEYIMWHKVSQTCVCLGEYAIVLRLKMPLRWSARTSRTPMVFGDNFLFVDSSRVVVFCVYFFFVSLSVEWSTTTVPFRKNELWRFEFFYIMNHGFVVVAHFLAF